MKTTIANRKILFIIFGLATLCFTSCLKDRYYKFKVINNTNYRLDNVVLYGSGKTKGVTVEPYTESGEFIVIYDRGVYPARLFAEPLFSVHVRLYSDSLGQHQDTGVTGQPFSTLLKKGTNTVKIDLYTTPRNPSEIFDISIN